MRQLPHPRLIFASAVAALLYWSWPIGFWLNPTVAAHSLASQLEAPGQPFSWLFVVLDILAGLLVLAIGIRWLISRHIWQRTAGVCLALFGGLVMLAALMPLDCDPTIMNCQPLLSHPTLVVHGVASILSSLGLLAAVVILTRQAYVRVGSVKLNGLLLGLLFGWILFAALSLVLPALKVHTNLVQYYFISLCSLSIPAVVLAGSLVLREPNLVA